MDIENKKEYFDYLDYLRESGETNMFGAVPYIERAFPELKGGKSNEVLLEWMSKF